MKRTRKNLNFEQTECSICLQAWSQPCKLPCGHIFCFLCIKGSLLDRSECALCRTSVKADFILNPNLVSYVNRHFLKEIFS